MKGKAITSDMGELLHAEIDITGNETLRIKSQCVIETSLTEEELNKYIHSNRKRRKRQIYCHAGL